MKVVEFFSGIGGIKCALNELSDEFNVVAAFDINDVANSVYKNNFSNPCYNKVIESVSPDNLRTLSADLWTMSPPCQPYTRNGKMLDLKDKRTTAMKHVISLISQVRPKYLFVENVKGFELSDGRELLVSMLLQCGYTYKEYLLTPLQFGVPNSRLRYYLIATTQPSQRVFANINTISMEPFFECTLRNCSCQVCMKFTENISKDDLTFYENNIQFCSKISDFLELQNVEDKEECYRYLDDKELEKSFMTLDIINGTSKRTCCFIKCYSKKMEGSGSVLQTAPDVNVNIAKENLIKGSLQLIDYAKNLKLRFFTPREIANLMCFPKHFKFPTNISQRQRYRLLGNSVNVRVVAHVLQWLTEM